MTVVPHSIFEKRDDKCVDCPSKPKNSCPKCASGKECYLVSQTCKKCAYYKCTPIDGGSTNSTPVGGIIGGAIGGFVLLLLVAGILYYKFVYRKRHPVLLEEDDDILMSGIESESDRKSDYTISNLDSYQGDPNMGPVGGVMRNGSGLEKTGTRSAAANKRISSYESFTRPKARYNKNSRRGGGRGGTRMRTRVGAYLDTNSSRHSVATTMSTTNASNILPIAYIPGVTVRPTKNNTRSIYSYETESVFSDLNTIENASIIGDVMRANQLQDANAGHDTNANGSTNKDSTMTAIKAQPKLINVDRIEEEDEDDITDEEDDTYGDTYGETYDDSLVAYEAQNNATNTMNIRDSQTSIPQENPVDISSEELEYINVNGNDDADSDSDVDSDIGEITRATSVKRPADSIPQSREVLLDITGGPNATSSTTEDTNREAFELSQLGRPTGPSHHPVNGVDSPTNTSAGSFILDVEFEDSGPFKDP
ncbi:uncharacterized protein AC631_04670 [Debaryomyces fabryi]|uniref:Membrane anchor Opy2 N-terminal domain-containing protein n=1 Tax=Debaryomyces fabryi TaxID=58627 RepID=A0A0V1PTX8_9ASCO|nr:uncharacterized protein AC631_04670 [Debaryomyces fabryi]KRZ99572.1 hypothetical protein AC631_04670 [Debaryomyces fabryi]CUM45636.1 unnamed protein product [Debaryomyces fabryi]